MGWFSSSKPATPAPTAEDVAKLSAPTLDLSKFTVTGDYAEQLKKQSEAAIKKAQEVVKSQSATIGFDTRIIWGLVAAIVIFGIFVLIDYIYYKATGRDLSWMDWLNFDSGSTGPSSAGGQVPANQILYIANAVYGTNRTDPSEHVDVTDYLASQIVGETTLPSFVVSWANLGLKTNPFPDKRNTLFVKYYVGTSDTVSVNATDGSPFPQLPQGTTTRGQRKEVGTAAPKQSALTKMYNSIFGDSSGNLAPKFHDATTSASIKGQDAPLSSEDQGGYGMQWWMYVKDWNYGYGKQKSVVVRPDTTNPAVNNPNISLHPTDNTLQVSVSIYPATEGGSSKAKPAPAGHSGSTDDVFVCEVPNIPLQTWFAVGVTVFGRNMDIYIDGKLVKSCFLTGVPKPAVGDIQLTPGGGYSGRLCDFYHYPRMLTPGDAMTFAAKGTPCKSQTEGAGTATGYSVKFGVYDSLGKEVQEYTF